MTVSASDDIKLSYVGDGATTARTTPQFLVNGDITAVLATDATGVETPLVLGTDYNLTGAGDPSGTLTTTGPLSPHAVGTTLTIKGAPVLEQETDFVEGGNFGSTALESELDRSRLIDKSIAEDFTRTLQYPLSDTAPTAVLPPAIDRAGKVLTFDEFGSPDVSAALDLISLIINVTDSPTTIDESFRGATVFIQNQTLGEDTNAGREFVNLMKRYTSGGTIWYSRLAYERLILDQLQTIMDPKARRSFKAKERWARRDYDQRFWWRPGRTAPSRPPDLSTAVAN